jgi:hypothetical protein
VAGTGVKKCGKNLGLRLQLQQLEEARHLMSPVDTRAHKKAEAEAEAEAAAAAAAASEKPKPKKK